MLYTGNNNTPIAPAIPKRTKAGDIPLWYIALLTEKAVFRITPRINTIRNTIDNVKRM
jgi:hypothetical protein